MTAPRFTAVTSKVVAILDGDVDTDQIVPARFLKTTSKDGLASALFHDWRGRPGFALDDPRMVGRRILVAGPNFGCGSSREHAPWALLAWGFSAIVAPSFADIFRSNALGNGLVTAAIAADAHAALVATLAAEPEVTVDLAGLEVRWSGQTAAFAVDPFRRKLLVDGVDELGFLLSLEPDIARHEAAIPPERRFAPRTSGAS
jgi:3-isopropylmalate/(R)-2-methylmalate dehydratase small subunit